MGRTIQICTTNTRGFVQFAQTFKNHFFGHFFKKKGLTTG